MEANKYLEEEKNIIDEEVKNVNAKYDKKELLSLLGIVFFTTLGTFNMFAIPLLGATLYGGAIASLEAKLSNKKRMKEELDRLAREKSHINKISEKGLNTSREMAEKRIRKVNSLIAENNRKTNTYKAWRRANNVALAGIGVSLVVGAFIPFAGLVAAAATTGAKIVTGNRLNKSHEELQINKNRLNNLITDINTIKLQAKPARPVKKNTSVRQVQQKTGKVNTKQTQNERAVQAYIERLAKQSQQAPRAKQIKK